MHTRFLAALLVSVLTLGFWQAPGLCGPKQPSPSPLFLSQEYLQGSMQGQSGIALDLNGDGQEDLVVGAPYAHFKGASGALLVYLGSVTGFSRHPACLVQGDGNLGWSLAPLGEVMGVGAGVFAAGAFSGSAPEGSLTGTVTLFNGGAQPQPFAALAGENAMDKFGYALAAGDLNGDGFPDLIVGAPFHSPSAALYQRGAVYIYFGPDYNPGTRLKIPATGENGGIGFSLASGDINGDGVADLLLQASGKVICYYGTPVPKESFVLPPAPNAVFTSKDAGFGRSIAVLENGLVAIGADQATIGDAIDSGRLFILNGSAGGIVDADAVAVKIDGDANCGRFGSTILPLTDVDGDGIPDLAVSAVHADGTSWLVTGKIFLFSGATLTTGAPATIGTFPGEVRDMHLGNFLAVVGNGSQLAAGAPTEHANTGRIRLFDLVESH